jgi:MFS family permease
VLRRLRTWQWRGRQAYRLAWKQEEANTRYLYQEVAWYGVLSGLAGSFLAVFVLRLGGSNALIGLLTSLPALITILWLAPAGRIIERQSSRLNLVLVTAFLTRLAYLLVALAPLVFVAFRAEAVVAVIVLGTIPASMCSVAFSAMLADLVPVQRRARVVGLRNFLVSVSSTLAVLLGGWFLGLLPFPANFQWLFAAGFFTSLVSLYYLSRLKLADGAAPSAPVDEQPRPLIRRLRDHLAMLSGHRPFARFALCAFAYHWGLYLTIPLYSIYWVRNLHASDSWIGFIGMVLGAVTALAYPFWGRQASRHGARKVLLVSALAGTLYPILTGLSPVVEALLVPAVVGGVASAGFGLSLFNRLLEVAPDERRPSFLAAYNVLINVAVFIAPLIGTALIDSIGIVNALLLGGILRFAGFLAFARYA